ncbi:unnamed protein product [Urochloa decumbens]|uniref:F-box domain-containing protein n=1 Tax=Urochloa decumbens TaxID=240449 RepID=A0ABC9GAA7_9POAL
MVSGGSETDRPDPNPKRGEVTVACPSDDTLVEILSRLPPKPRFRFKCVSKPWRDLIADRLRCRKFPQTLEGFFFGGTDDEKYGNFVDLLGRPSPLVDASFSFLTKQPEIEKINLLGSCNGLVLFGHGRASDIYDSLGYIVCNPATEQWVAMTRSGWTPFDDSEVICTYLIFDPTVSSHFELVQFTQDDEGVILIDDEGVMLNDDGDDDDKGAMEVRTYSSESRVWSGGKTIKLGAHRRILSYLGSPLVNGMLHFNVGHEYGKEDRIVAVDREVKKCRNIHWPEKHGEIILVGQSQGLLHCISRHTKTIETADLSVWVLVDYDTEEWVLKHSVSFAHLSGKSGRAHAFSFCFVSIHPHRNMVFFVPSESQKLMSYDMDSKEMCVLCTVGCDYPYVTQYVPYFSESPALGRKH